MLNVVNDGCRGRVRLFPAVVSFQVRGASDQDRLSEVCDA